MNQRLKLLAEQAGFSTELSEAMATRHNTTSGLEKFAELIIQECARIARATPCPYNDEEIKQVFGHTWDIAALAAGRSIKDYFGVRR
jgi:hypothetical protein